MGFHGGGERRLEVKVKKCISRLINFKEIIDLNIYFYDIYDISFSERDQFQLKSLNLIEAIININKF